MADRTIYPRKVLQDIDLSQNDLFNVRKIENDSHPILIDSDKKVEINSTLTDGETTRTTNMSVSQGKLDVSADVSSSLVSPTIETTSDVLTNTVSSKYSTSVGDKSILVGEEEGVVSLKNGDSSSLVVKSGYLEGSSENVFLTSSETLSETSKNTTRTVTETLSETASKISQKGTTFYTLDTPSTTIKDSSDSSIGDLFTLTKSQAKLNLESDNADLTVSVKDYVDVYSNQVAFTNNGTNLEITDVNNSESTGLFEVNVKENTTEESKDSSSIVVSSQGVTSSTTPKSLEETRIFQGLITETVGEESVTKSQIKASIGDRSYVITEKNKISLESEQVSAHSTKETSVSSDTNVKSSVGDNFLEITSSNINITGETFVTGNTSLTGTLGVTGTSTFNKKVTVESEGIAVTGNSTFNNDLEVKGSSTFKSTVELESNASLTVGGSTTLNNGLTVSKGEGSLDVSDIKSEIKFNKNLVSVDEEGGHINVTSLKVDSTGDITSSVGDNEVLIDSSGVSLNGSKTSISTTSTEVISSDISLGNATSTSKVTVRGSNGLQIKTKGSEISSSYGDDESVIVSDNYIFNNTLKSNNIEIYWDDTNNSLVFGKV